MRRVSIILAALGAALSIAWAGPGPAAGAARPSWWGQIQKQAQSDGYRLLTAPQLKRLVKKPGKYIIIDVRPAYEYKADHVPGAKNLEFHLGHRYGLDPAQVKALAALAGPAGDQRIIFYCRSFRCLRSSVAARWAVKLGYRNVWRFPAGWYGWQAATGGAKAAPASRGLKVGDIFPACRLVVLNSRRDRPYLGLRPGSRRFALSEVKADYILVEFYNELCFGCLRAVKSYNELFIMIESDKRLSGKLKMIGMGVGSLLREVVHFRRKHGVLFPLFADQKQEVFGCLGKPALPTLYLLVRQGRNWRIIMTFSEHAGTPRRLLQMIKSAICGQAPVS